MRIFLIAIFLYILAILESTVPINFALIVILVWSMTRPISEVLLWALLAGLFVDLIIGVNFGRIIAVIAVIAAASNFICTRFIKEINIWSKIIILFSASLLYNFACFFSFNWQTAILNTILGILLFKWISLLKV